MKNAITILGAIIFASNILVSCGQTDNKQKELELKEKELSLKQRELELQEKKANQTPSVPTPTSGDKFLGHWSDSRQFQSITITKAGETAYTIRIHQRGMVVYTYTTTYEKGNLVGGGLGSPTIAYSNGKIIYEGDEYKKSN